MQDTMLISSHCVFSFDRATGALDVAFYDSSETLELAARVFLDRHGDLAKFKVAPECAEFSADIEAYLETEWDSVLESIRYKIDDDYHRHGPDDDARW